VSTQTRRDFIYRSVAGAAGLGLFLNGGGVSLCASAELPGPAGPNDRLNVGFIGFGIRGNVLMEAIKTTGQANLVCACDCYQGHLDNAKQRTDGKIDVNFAQYKKLLDRKDIDAVVIATPEHWHLQQVLDACAAGKDVYIEKPLTRSIEEGPKIIAAAKRYDRIVEVGSQWISSPIQKRAKELLQSDVIGKVTKIMASYDSNSLTSAWNYPIPPGLENGVNFNWEEWLGPAPKLPYDPERVFRYLKYWDYSGGIATHLFVHLITTIHYLMDVQMPEYVQAIGAILARNDGREVPDTLDALFHYSTFHVNLSSTMNNSTFAPQGISLLGTKGTLTLFLGRNGMDLKNDQNLSEGIHLTAENPSEDYSYAVDSWPQEYQQEFWAVDAHRQQAHPYVEREGTAKIKPGADSPDATVFHLAEFFDCVRSRRQPVENATMGHQAAAAAHMVNLSFRCGKRMVWDDADQTAQEA
jgi:predicted dehydrogenase